MAGSEDLEKNLRADIDEYIDAQVSGLREEIGRLQSQLNEAFTRFSERFASGVRSDASIAVAIADYLRAARDQGIEAAAAESARARASSDMAILKAAIDDIDSQRTQADILTALVNRAAAFAPRIAFFVIKNERATGWRARGLEGTVGDDAVRELSLPLSSDTLLSAVARSRSTWSGSPGAHADDHVIFRHFGDNPPQRIVAIPLIAREKPVALLYADSADLDEDAISLEALESLVHVAGMAVELLATKRPAPGESKGETAPSATTTQSSTDTMRPTPVAGQTGALDDRSVPPVMPAPPRQPAVTAEFTPSSSESVTDGATGGRAAEATVATETSTASPAPAPATPLSATKRYGADAGLPIEVREEEKRFHNDARRFARLLVSEIKLYNEQKVREGRIEGDLYDRLREDIDRSRQMYDKRVAPEVVGRYDYFHHELVNTLAEGDASKLGAGYPKADERP